MIALQNGRRRHGAATSTELRILRQGPAAARDGARICSYECTFCADCVENKLAQRLPELRRRLRAAADPALEGMAAGRVRGKAAPSDKRVHLKYSLEDVAAHCARVKDIPPEER